MNAEQIMECIRVVAHYNTAILSLAENFERDLPDASGFRRRVEQEVSDGSTVFDALARATPRLADDIHDFVYQIVCPNNSITMRDITRERVAREVLNLV